MEARLLIDMDGTFVDTMGGAFDLYAKNSIHEDVTEYWFTGMQEKDLMLLALKSEGFYRDLEPITGAVRAINRLRREFDVVVCTAPMKGVKSCEADKRAWLNHYFDVNFADTAIVTTDKASVPGRALIEDNPYIEVPHRIIIFDQPWNREVDYPRMYGWGDLKMVRGVMDGTL